jgi:hypothetical protein
MRVSITISVDVNDSDLDWSESTVDEVYEDGRTQYEVEAIASYNGHPVDDMDYDAASEYLIEREQEIAWEHGFSRIPRRVSR